MYTHVFICEYMYVYIYTWRLGLCCSGVCLTQLLFTFFGGTGSPTEPESYQVSFFRQAILWALGSTYPCLIGMFHHKWNFSCILRGLNSDSHVCMANTLQTEPYPQLPTWKCKNKKESFGEAENTIHFVRSQCSNSFIFNNPYAENKYAADLFYKHNDRSYLYENHSRLCFNYELN